MIGSHDSYTYQKAKSWVVNLISRYWRCQNKDIQDQYNSGVRFFDVRVFLNKKGKWQTAHGISEFNRQWDTIDDICKFFDEKNVKYRIWLEKGSNDSWKLFSEQAKKAGDIYPGFVQAVRKSGETILFQKPSYPNMKYFACKMEDPKNLLKGLYTYPIKDWAKKNNPEITQEMIEDQSICYFMDFV